MKRINFSAILFLFAIAIATLTPLCEAKPESEVLSVPVTVKNIYGKEIAQDIVVTVFTDPATPSPRPVVVIGHGRAALAEQRATMGRAAFTVISNWFASLGYIVVVPTRIGYGESRGEDAEDSGDCMRKKYAPAFRAAADQTIQVLAAVRQHPKFGPQIQPDKTIVVGQSFGGATAIALASMNPPGVQLFINFAGGGGGNPTTQPKNPCDPRQLRRVFGEYGLTAKLPTLWIYTENDLFWGSELPKEWFEAYKANASKNGAVSEFIQLPANGTDGHGVFFRVPELWRNQVLDFIKQHGEAGTK